MLEEFRQKYVQECLVDQLPMSDELNQLFNEVLANEFNGDPMKMDELINSLRQENTPEEKTLEETVEQLKQENETLKGAVLEMSNFMLGGEDDV